MNKKNIIEKSPASPHCATTKTLSALLGIPEALCGGFKDFMNAAAGARPLGTIKRSGPGRRPSAWDPDDFTLGPALVGARLREFGGRSITATELACFMGVPRGAAAGLLAVLRRHAELRNEVGLVTKTRKRMGRRGKPPVEYDVEEVCVALELVGSDLAARFAEHAHRAS